MARIRQLAAATIARIAAGEVIDRPASVLRELIDNAIDSGAKNVSIATRGGGIDSIAITDDGCGIERSDLPLAFQQSATSKIADSDDLFSVATLGFRGEALASIAAVAEVTLKSRQSEAEHAYAVDVHEGKVSPSRPTALPSGTRVEVNDLFLRLPARRKFLKTVRAENNALRGVLVRTALANMGVSFRGSIEDKPIELPAARLAQPDGAMKARLSYLLGEDFSAAAKYVEAQGDRLAVRGFLCPPSISRSRRDRQHLIVNGRPVLDNALATMVQRSYGDTIYGHRHPQWVLYIDVPTEEVDVNVHPAKAHVRFRDERRIMGQLFRLCEDAIGKMRAGSESDARVVSKPLATLRPASSPPTKGIESPTVPEVTGKPANKDVLAFPTVEASEAAKFCQCREPGAERTQLRQRKHSRSVVP